MTPADQAGELADGIARAFDRSHLQRAIVEDLQRQIAAVTAIPDPHLDPPLRFARGGLYTSLADDGMSFGFDRDVENLDQEDYRRTVDRVASVFADQPHAAYLHLGVSTPPPAVPCRCASCRPPRITTAARAAGRTVTGWLAALGGALVALASAAPRAIPPPRTWLSVEHAVERDRALAARADTEVAALLAADRLTDLRKDQAP